MGLFSYKENKVVIEPDSLAIPVFREIWRRDKDRNKERAIKELSYIYFITDYKSPYNIYPDGKREDMIKSDFIKEDKWKPDDLIKSAITKYEEFQQTPSLRLLKAARKAQDEITNYLETGECEKFPDIKELMTVVNAVGKAVESVDKVEEKVKKEMTNSNRSKGQGGDDNMFED